MFTNLFQASTRPAKGYRSITHLEWLFDECTEIIVCRNREVIRGKGVYEDRFLGRGRIPDVIIDIKFQTRNVRKICVSGKGGDYELDTKFNPPFVNAFCKLKIIPIDENLPFECIQTCKYCFITHENNKPQMYIFYQGIRFGFTDTFLRISTPRHVKYWMLQKKLDGIKSNIKERKLLNLIISYANPVQLHPKNSISIFDFYIPLSIKLTEKNGNIPEIIKNIWDFYDDNKDEKLWIN